MSESKKQEIHVPTRYSFAIVSYSVLFAELAPSAVLSD